MFSMNFLYFYFTIILTTECSDLALSRWVTQFHAVEDLNLFQHYYIQRKQIFKISDNFLNIGSGDCLINSANINVVMTVISPERVKTVRKYSWSIPGNIYSRFSSYLKHLLLNFKKVLMECALCRKLDFIAILSHSPQNYKKILDEYFSCAIR